MATMNGRGTMDRTRQSHRRNLGRVSNAQHLYSLDPNMLTDEERKLIWRSHRSVLWRTFFCFRKFICEHICSEETRRIGYDLQERQLIEKLFERRTETVKEVDS